MVYTMELVTLNAFRQKMQIKLEIQNTKVGVNKVF